MQESGTSNDECNSKLGGPPRSGQSGPVSNEWGNAPNTRQDAIIMLQETVACLSCRVGDLEGKVNDLELDIKSTTTCRVCYKNVPIDGIANVNVLGCGHAFCSVCALSMRHCAICNALVDQVGKFKLSI